MTDETNITINLAVDSTRLGEFISRLIKIKSELAVNGSIGSEPSKESVGTEATVAIVDEVVPVKPSEAVSKKIIASDPPRAFHEALERLNKKRKNEWLRSANGIHDFIQRHVVDTGDPKDKLTLTELYDSYTCYAISQNIKNIYTKQSFRQNFEDLGAIRVQTTKAHRAVTYLGYKLVATDDFEDL